MPKQTDPARPAADPVADLSRATTSRRTTTAGPQDVWAVLADGWLFATWVVGASRVRNVARRWPAAGTSLHHSVGAWPVVLDDSTTVTEVEPGRRLLLTARTRPLGVHTVEVVLEPGAGGGTTVSMREDSASGPMSWSPLAVRQLGLTVRNRESLHRLCLMAEGRSGRSGA